MAYKLRHECERCGLAAEFERAGRFRDEDFYELLHEYFAIEQHLIAARQRIEDMRWLLNILPDLPDVEFVDEENPFH